MFVSYLIGWMRIPVFIPSSVHGSTKVSVIIAARNEENNIGNILKDLLAQTYPPELFRIVVVNDFSEDRTASVVEQLHNQRISLLHLKNYLPDKSIITSFKKKALEYGIEESSGELIITTDADCRLNQEWLKTIVGFYESKHCHMIVAPVAFTDRTGLLQGFQSLELIGLIGITGATLQWNIPTICNGANLAFKKESFYQVGGYHSIDHASSGDDVLLMHKIAKLRSKDILFLKNKDAICYTIPQDGLISFLNQRIRWASKFKYYDIWYINITQGIVFVFYLLLMVNLFLSFFEDRFFYLFLMPLLLKIISEFIFYFGVNKFFKHQKLLSLFLPAQLLHPLYVVISGVGSLFYKPKWKGRKIS
jgi:cellulose synthase/poly-beta-1,6-N-acetylglucosamine synthase-like glycosyltransferase